MMKLFCCVALLAITMARALAAPPIGVPALAVTAPNGQTSVLIGSVHVGIWGLYEPDPWIFEGARRYVIEHANSRSSDEEERDLGVLAPWAADLSKKEIAEYLRRAECGSVTKEGALSLLRRPTVQNANQLAYTICNQPPVISRDVLLSVSHPHGLAVDVLEEDADVEVKRRMVQKNWEAPVSSGFWRMIQKRSCKASRRL